MTKWLDYVYRADAVAEGSTSYKDIFDVLVANGGYRGRAGAPTHMPPYQPGCDPVTGAAFQKPAPGAHFQRMRRAFRLW